MRDGALLGLLLLTGCADKSAPMSDDGPSAGADAATPIVHDERDDAETSPATSAEDAEVSDVDARSVEPSASISDAGASPDASTATSDASSAKSDAATDAGRDAGAPPTPSGTATYRAERYIGGLDHLTIFKRDEARGYCVVVHLSSPASSSNTEVQLPERWALQAIQAIDAASCELPSSTQGTPATRTSLSAQGRIAWRKLGAHGQPCSVDVELSVSFDSVGHIPSSDRVLVEDLAVQCD